MHSFHGHRQPPKGMNNSPYLQGSAPHQQGGDPSTKQAGKDKCAVQL